MRLLALLGFAPDEHDQKLRDLMKNSWESVTVSARGTVHIDPAEVSRSPEMKEARQKASDILRRARP